MYSDLPVFRLSDRIGNLNLHTPQPVSNRSEALQPGQQASRFTYLHRPSLTPQELLSSAKPRLVCLTFTNASVDHNSYTSPARPLTDAPTQLGSISKDGLKSAKAKILPIKRAHLR